jgi:hypothetical protein
MREWLTIAVVVLAVLHLVTWFAKDPKEVGIASGWRLAVLSLFLITVLLLAAVG